MRKLLAIALVLCIFTAMAVGTAAAKPALSLKGKVVQQQAIAGVGDSVTIGQEQFNAAYLTPQGGVALVSQTTIGQVINGEIVSQQSTGIAVKLKVA